MSGLDDAEALLSKAFELDREAEILESRARKAGEDAREAARIGGDAAKLAHGLRLRMTADKAKNLVCLNDYRQARELWEKNSDLAAHQAQVTAVSAARAKQEIALAKDFRAQAKKARKEAAGIGAKVLAFPKKS